MWVLRVSVDSVCTAGCVVFVPAFVLPALSLCVFFYSFILLLFGGVLWRKLGHTHTRARARSRLSDMPSGGCLCLTRSITPVSSTRYKARRHGDSDSNREPELLFFVITACQKCL